VLAFASFWVLDDSLSAVDAFDAAIDDTLCASVPPELIDANFVWDGLYFDGVADSSLSTDPPDDGLPSTERQLTYPGLRRDVVMLTEPPADADVQRAVGPYRSSGLLGFTRAEVWIVAREDLVDPLLQCRD
jgi:hypothetical protein